MKLKHDKFKTARGGASKLLELSCQLCDTAICRYQKDGTGNLWRLYVDRISSPNVSLTGEDLRCQNGHLLGVKTIYAKENRPAFRLISGSYAKKIIKN
ncbi:MAG: hypothetical protein HGA31_04010 [Candidatus Moranbacteria bacterium]|nr:hypothetical protein [Candidatus Moranbacteria bacterium]